MNNSIRAFGLIALMLLSPLAGCFGQADSEDENSTDVLQIDFQPAEEATLKAGEWHTFTLKGEGTRLVVKQDVLLFVNDSIVPLGVVQVQNADSINGKILTTPYVESTLFNIIYSDGTGASVEVTVENGTPIVNGEEWFDQMSFILSVCTDSTECGGYINRWMGSPNPAFERAASFFHGQFEGLGYETHIMRVTDHLNPTQPE
jgi:hypothetical protein